MIPFKKLSAQENEDLLKFPAYICMTAFKEHVSKAHSSIFVNFLIPVAIPGLTK
jgi:hypothetical protein